MYNRDWTNRLKIQAVDLIFKNNMHGPKIGTKSINQLTLAQNQFHGAQALALALNHLFS